MQLHGSATMFHSLRPSRALLSATTVAQLRSTICLSTKLLHRSQALGQHRQALVSQHLEVEHRLGICPLLWRRHYSASIPPQNFTPNSEKKLAAHPEQVTATSTTRPLFEPDPPSTTVDKQDAQDILRGVKSDLNTVKDTFALSSVPRESYALGLAGTLPYLGTSVSTVYLGWNLRTPWPTDNNLLNSFMVNNETAQQWLQLLEPIQLGYGAVIISFLGAIHWGLEYAEKSPVIERTRFRYAIGVLAPAVAWPTLMMPIQFALISQFAAFTALYFVDARATARGWAPAWYGTYRFVLTFIVGGAIFISLVGRAKVGDDRARLSSNRLEETMSYKHNQQHSSAHWAKLEAEERERNRKAKREAEQKAKKDAEKNSNSGSNDDHKNNLKVEGEEVDGHGERNQQQNSGDDSADQRESNDGAQDNSDDAAEKSSADPGDGNSRQPHSKPQDNQDSKKENPKSKEGGNPSKGVKK